MIREVKAMDKHLVVLNAMSKVTHSTDMDEFMHMANLTSTDVRNILKELSREGFVTKTGKGYVIAEKGKLAVIALSPLPTDRAFHFYFDIDQSADISAENVKEFYDAVKTIPVKSLEFHLQRTDLENWFMTVVEDAVFARELAELRRMELKGEALREHILQNLKTRYKDVLESQWNT